MHHRLCQWGATNRIAEGKSRRDAAVRGRTFRLGRAPESWGAPNAGRMEITEGPITLANDIGAVRSMALSPISVSATGVPAYQGVGQPTRQMVWMDSGGWQLAVSGTPGNWGPPRISPDGNRAVVA
jgi:hypothetical protein